MKIFGIGFHKTGTKSLATAFEVLGFRVTGPNFLRMENLDEALLPAARKIAERFDAFRDNPWPILFREMDAIFPGSKFVLTTRDVDAWLKSSVSHFGTEETNMRRYIYGAGSPVGNEEMYRTRFLKHYDDVREHFRGRGDDLLEISVVGGEGWERLCPFLGLDVPDRPFPRENVAKRPSRSQAP